MRKTQNINEYSDVKSINEYKCVTSKKKGKKILKEEGKKLFAGVLIAIPLILQFGERLFPVVRKIVFFSPISIMVLPFLLDTLRERIPK